MSGERYTQIKRPVSRLTEKLLGWISWIFLLILTVITMFIALVSFSNDTSIQNLENSMNNNQLIRFECYLIIHGKFLLLIINPVYR